MCAFSFVCVCVCSRGLLCVCVCVSFVLLVSGSCLSHHRPDRVKTALYFADFPVDAEDWQVSFLLKIHTNVVGLSFIIIMTVACIRRKGRYSTTVMVR